MTWCSQPTKNTQRSSGHVRGKIRKYLEDIEDKRRVLFFVTEIEAFEDHSMVAPHAPLNLDLQ